MRTSSLTFRLSLLTSLVLLGCSGGKGSGSEAGNGKSGPVVALVNGHPVTAEEVEAKLREQPAFIRARYATPEKKKEFLDNLIRFELLAQEARRAGLDKDPEIQATLQKVMVQKLLRQQQEATGTVSETELRKYYDEHLSEFVRPERVRVSHVFLPAAEGDTAKRNQARAAATKLLADVKAKSAGANTSAFELAAAEHSADTATKSAGGDLGFLSREELAQAWEAPLADAAFAITADSGVGPVVETSKGFHLVKLLGRQLGTNQDFDSVKARIESRLLSERRARGLDDFITGLKSKAQIEVRDDVLAQVKVDAEGAPTLPPSPDARQP